MMKRTESKRLNWLLTLALVLVLATGIFSLPTWARAEEGVEPSHAVVFSYGTKEYTLTVGSEVGLLDDRVKVNYAKFQGVEVAREDMKNVKVDLLVCHNIVLIFEHFKRYPSFYANKGKTGLLDKSLTHSVL